MNKFNLKTVIMNIACVILERTVDDTLLKAWLNGRKVLLPTEEIFALKGYLFVFLTEAPLT